MKYSEDERSEIEQNKVDLMLIYQEYKRKFKVLQGGSEHYS